MNGFRGHPRVTVTGGLEEVVTPWAGAAVGCAHMHKELGDLTKQR